MGQFFLRLDAFSATVLPSFVVDNDCAKIELIAEIGRIIPFQIMAEARESHGIHASTDRKSYIKSAISHL